MLLALVTTASLAGPIPMFQSSTSVTSPPAISTPAPARPQVGSRPESRATPSRYNSLGPSPSAAGLPVLPVVIAVAPTGPSTRSVVVDSTPEPTRPPALPRVAAEPHKRKVATPGRLTPIDELPSALQPIQRAPNLLPVAQIRSSD
ncbi:MAG: hypothetical protein KTR31_39015 [Myxococcales bacterium]|nr:hypothetical protein [Myxococcales bacterium]